ncbi:MAG TPA: lysozyme, partial [Candidatus Binataceae bacterium]|nr:lysozyme [Candidatus Binataceae bacterium]
AEQIFRGDLNRDAEEPVNCSVEVPLAQNQFDALVSLAFNIGENCFKHSTLLKFLNFGDYLGAGKQFCVWDEVRVRGSLRVCSDLERRRKAEQEMFMRR